MTPKPSCIAPNMMKALLEILDQLLYLIEQHQSGESYGVEAFGVNALDAHSGAELVELLEGLAKEALTMAQSMRLEQLRDSDNESLAARQEELLQRGLEAIARGKMEEAERLLEAALEEFPEHDEYYNHLGLVAWERGDMARAEHYYGRAAQLSLSQLGQCEQPWSSARHRSYLRALEGQALCLYRLGRLDDACDLFETLAMTCVPEYQGCHYLAGEIHHMMGRLTKAARAYMLAPSEPSVLYNLALVYFCQHELESCATTLLRAFNANRYICEALLERLSSDTHSYHGYLATPMYAAEFIEACAPLWQDQQEALTFMERCYDHPLVQHQLHRREQQEEAELWALQHYAADTADASTEELRRYRGLAQQLLERLVF